MIAPTSSHDRGASTFSTNILQSGGAHLGGTTPPRRGAGAGAFLLAIVTAGALGHVGVRFKGLEVAYDLGRERRIATDLEEQRRRLQIEIGMLKDPRRIVAIARDTLNMGPPNPDAIRRLGSGGLWSAPSLHAPSTNTKNPVRLQKPRARAPRAGASASPEKPAQ